jgi:hypothetical protein
MIWRSSTLLIESVTPLTVKLPTGDVRLMPGVPVELPTAQAQRLLVKAHGKVRETTRGWLPTWQELGALTAGLTPHDPRLPQVMSELDRCDDAYLSGDWVTFRQAASRVRDAITRGDER